MPVLNRDKNILAATVTYKTCARCGDIFAVKTLSQYAYKITADSRLHYFCSYGCKMANEHDYPPRNTQSGMWKYPKPKSTWEREDKEEKAFYENLKSKNTEGRDKEE